MKDNMNALVEALQLANNFGGDGFAKSQCARAAAAIAKLSEANEELMDIANTNLDASFNALKERDEASRLLEVWQGRLRICLRERDEAQTLLKATKPEVEVIFNKYVDDIQSYADQRDSALALLAQAKEAMKPFGELAEFLDKHNPEAPDSTELGGVSAGRVRKARAALAAIEEGERAGLREDSCPCAAIVEIENGIGRANAVPLFSSPIYLPSEEAVRVAKAKFDEVYDYRGPTDYMTPSISAAYAIDFPAAIAEARRQGRIEMREEALKVCQPKLTDEDWMWSPDAIVRLHDPIRALPEKGIGE